MTTIRPSPSPTISIPPPSPTEPAPRPPPSEAIDNSERSTTDDGLETAGHVTAGISSASSAIGAAGVVVKRVVAPVGWAIDGVNLGLAIREGVETGNYRRVATTSSAIGGSLGGAAAGAAIGSAIVPIVGTFIGGVIGAVSGGTAASWIGGKVFESARPGPARSSTRAGPGPRPAPATRARSGGITTASACSAFARSTTTCTSS